MFHRCGHPVALSRGRQGMEETFFERERGQVVQCSCCSRSLAELNPLAPSLPSCNVPPIRDRRHPHFLQRRRRPRPPLSPSFLPGGLPACLPLPLSFSFNSRLILLFCITKDKSNLDLSPLPLLSAKNGRPSDRPTVRPSVRFRGRGTTSWLSAVAAARAILRSISLHSVALPSLRVEREGGVL